MDKIISILDKLVLVINNVIILSLLFIIYLLLNYLVMKNYNLSGLKIKQDNNNSTMFKTFANWSDLIKKCSGYKIYIELSNKYFIPVAKNDLKKVSDSMNRNEDKFCGKITFASGGHKYVQISIQN